MKQLTRLPVLLGVALLAIACSGGPAAPTATPTAGAPPVIVTRPMDTPTPIVTPVPLPEPIPAWLERPYYVSGDNFATGDLANWRVWQWVTSSNGQLVLTGKPPWAAGASYVTPMTAGLAVSLRMQFTPSSAYELYLFSGDWGDPEYRRFGFYNLAGVLRADLWQGETKLTEDRLPGRPELTPDNWYGVLLAIDRSGEFLALVWPESAPNEVTAYRETLGSDEATRNWWFGLGGDSGVVQIDDVSVIEFDGIAQ